MLFSGKHCLVLLAFAKIAAANTNRGLRAARCAVTHPIDVIDLSFETNAKDKDTGLFMNLMTPEPYSELTVSDPSGTQILALTAQSSLKAHGLEKLSFESAEPTIDQVSLETTFARFPAGMYTVAGKTMAGDCLLGTVELTHDIPVAPTITSPLNNANIEADMSLNVSWVRPGPSNITIVSYELVVTNEANEFESATRYPGNIFSGVVPKAFLESGMNYEVELLAYEKSGNLAATYVMVNTKEGLDDNVTAASFEGNQVSGGGTGASTPAANAADTMIGDGADRF